MHQPAADVVVRVAMYLRKSIIELAGCDSSIVGELLSSPYDEPRGPINLIKTVKGVLQGPVEKLPMEGRPYPIINWQSRLKSVSFDQNGRYAFDPDETMTAELGEGTLLRLGRFEVRDIRACQISNIHSPTSPSPSPHAAGSASKPAKST
jgi:hypothetical protein